MFLGKRSHSFVLRVVFLVRSVFAFSCVVCFWFAVGGCAVAEVYISDVDVSHISEVLCAKVDG